jgi:UDP-2,3-diacylglucosamine hydrolase
MKQERIISQKPGSISSATNAGKQNPTSDLLIPSAEQRAEFEELRSGLFISDLHLFSSRSDAHDQVEALRSMQEECQCIVLGGDIFDLRWSQRGGLQPTIEAAEDWLSRLLDQTGKSRVIYLAGNHDCHPSFAEAMRGMADQRERFTWFEHALRIGDSLFLHGDLLHAKPTPEGLLEYRKKHHHEDSPHQMLNKAYDLAVQLRLHKAVARLGNSPKATCFRLQNSLQEFDHNNGGPPVERIFFGHTHVNIPGLELGQQTFFNPGAMLKHTKNAPIEFELPKNR